MVESVASWPKCREHPEDIIYVCDRQECPKSGALYCLRCLSNGDHQHFLLVLVVDRLAALKEKPRPVDLWEAA